MERSGDLHINTCEALKNWNDNPTNELVYVAEWFYDHIFEVIKKNDYKEARQLRNEMIRFTMIYENMDLDQATDLLDKNLIFWDQRASYYVGSSKLEKIFKEDDGKSKMVLSRLWKRKRR